MWNVPAYCVAYDILIISAFFLCISLQKYDYCILIIVFFFRYNICKDKNQPCETLGILISPQFLPYYCYVPYDKLPAAN